MKQTGVPIKNARDVKESRGHLLLFVVGRRDVVTKFFTLDKMDLEEMFVCALILRNRKKSKRRKYWVHLLCSNRLISGTIFFGTSG